MPEVKFFSGEKLPLELHKVRIVQKLDLVPVERRLEAIKEAGNNTFLLQNKDIFLDMLTDSGVNAMSDNQQAAMLLADDSYAGSATFYRLKDKVCDIFGTTEFLPTHQGRACEHLIARAYVKPGQVVAMNYHFTTSKVHVTCLGGRVEELIIPEGLKPNSDHPFKGNYDLEALEALIKKEGPENMAYIRLEAGTNLVGGQPHSLENAKAMCALAKKYGILTVYDVSLLQDNLYFMKEREEACKNMSIREITRELCKDMDIIYFSARKLGFARGGGIATSSEKVVKDIREMVTLYEGFLTYGGMSVREMEAITVGLEETMDETIISQGPLFIEHMVNKLHKAGVPVITPAGGLGCHINARAFLSHVDDREYPAGALAAALYIASGVRGMERGTLYEQRDENGEEPIAHMELVRLALPRRVFTLSQVEYTIDRILWLWENRAMIGGLEWQEEPSALRFFFGRLGAKGDWQDKLAKKFREDFGTSL